MGLSLLSLRSFVVRTTVFVGLIAAGLAGNYFNFSILPNIDFLFGSIFAMLALQCLGPGRAVLAAALIAAYTYLLWNHPYAILIMTAEVAVVGWLVTRRRTGLVLADAIYWVGLGMPLVYVFYHGLMGVSLGNVAIIMSKQAVNGIVNALLARLIYTGLVLASRKAGITYRDLIFNLLTLFMLGPALILLVIASNSDFAETERHVRTELRQAGSSLSRRLEVWVENRMQVAAHLATLAATLKPAQMQDRLEQAVASDPNFQRLGMRDIESVIVAHAPLVDEFGQSNVGKKFSERPYMARLRQSLKPMLAEVVMGRIDRPAPTVILLAPVLRHGEYMGYVSGALKLDQIREHLEKSVEGSSLLYTLLDRKGQVILSNRQNQQMMKPLERGEGSMKRLDVHVSQWGPTLPPHTPVAEQWRSSFYVVEAPIGMQSDWTLVLEQPMAPFQKMLFERYSRALGLLLLILLAAMALVEFMSRRAMATLETLGAITHELPAQLAAGKQMIHWPASGMKETADLINNFRTMSDSLAAQFSEAGHIKASLEQRVVERTAELRDAEERYRTMIESAPEAVLVHRLGVILYANPAAITMFGAADAQALKARSTTELIHPQFRASQAARMQSILRHEPIPPMVESRFLRLDGTAFDVEVQGTAIVYAGEPAIHVSVRDISERQQAKQKLHLAASVFTHAREGIMITDPTGAIIDVNEAFSRITGYGRDEVLGQNPRLLKSGRQGPEFYASLWRDLGERGHWSGEIWNRRKSGEVYAEILTVSAVRDAQNQVQHYVALFSDITPFKEHEIQLERIAHFDALTGLPNRVLLADRLHQGMAQAQRRGQRLAVVFLDLDGFKLVNDSHGHQAGDQLLMAVAARMKQALREGDTLARIGGDEFVAVLVDLPDVAASLPMLNRLLGAAAQPMRLGDAQGQVSASLGVAFYPQAEEVDADQLLRQADHAMYQAKLAGKNRYHIFDAEQDRSVRGHHESLQDIRRALLAREFVLHYQPKVNMRTGAVIGVEALIRWQHPQRGLLSPAVFLPVIEDHALAVDVGEWVIDTALSQIALWRAAGLDLPISVNVGARQLQQPDFVPRLRALLAAHPLARPSSLELEVLETSALEDVARVSAVIEACREIGVMFALDDFGTGYSSLTYLKRLPVALLKIDQSFVRDMLDDPDDLAILQGVIGLARAFQRQVIAEGVETVAQGAKLLQLGCELGQGYGIARPMPAQQLPGWAADWQPDPAWGQADD